MVYSGMTFSIKKEAYGICNEVYLQMFGIAALSNHELTVVNVCKTF